MKTWRKVAATVAAVALSSTLTAIPAHASTHTTCTAHRGYEGLGAPENTLQSVDDAAKVNADAVETDIQFTKTGYPVIMHDASVDRTTNGTGKVITKTVGQVTALHTSNGAPVPTLYAMMHEMDVKGVRGLIEIKNNPTTTQWNNLVTKIPAGMKGKFIFHTYQSGAEWTALHHGYTSYRLMNSAYDASWVYAYPGINVDGTKITQAYVNKMHGKGLKVGAFISGASGQIDRLAWDPVDDIITDDIPQCVNSSYRH